MSITKTQRDLEARVAKCQSDLEAYRDGQKSNTTKLKRLQKEYDRQREIAGNENSSWTESNAARIKCGWQIGPEKDQLKAWIDKYPERIDLAEIQLIKAQNALREYKAEMDEVSSEFHSCA